MYLLNLWVKTSSVTKIKADSNSIFHFQNSQDLAKKRHALRLDIYIMPEPLVSIYMKRRTREKRKLNMSWYLTKTAWLDLHWDVESRGRWLPTASDAQYVFLHVLFVRFPVVFKLFANRLPTRRRLARDVYRAGWRFKAWPQPRAWHDLPQFGRTQARRPALLHSGNSDPLWDGSGPARQRFLWPRGTGKHQAQAAGKSCAEQTPRRACLEYGWTAGRWVGTWCLRAQVLAARVQVRIINSDASTELTLSFPRMINFKFALQPQQKYCIIHYGELGFHSLLRLKDDYTTNSHCITYTFPF